MAERKDLPRTVAADMSHKTWRLARDRHRFSSKLRGAVADHCLAVRQTRDRGFVVKIEHDRTDEIDLEGVVEFLEILEVYAATTMTPLP